MLRMMVFGIGMVMCAQTYNNCENVRTERAAVAHVGDAGTVTPPCSQNKRDGLAIPFYNREEFNKRRRFNETKDIRIFKK